MKAIGGVTSSRVLRKPETIAVQIRRRQISGIRNSRLIPVSTIGSNGHSTNSSISRPVQSKAGVTGIVTTESGVLSGLEGKALQWDQFEFPSMTEVMRSIPEHCFKRDTMKSMMYALTSTALTLSLGVAAYFLIPLKLAFLPAWIAYAVVTGTVATGCWVVAHECGHGAFSDNKFIQDLVGFVLHSTLLVPYFSWQRSHAVHHMRTNHLTEGETHVPGVRDPKGESFNEKMLAALGESGFTVTQLVFHLVFGWPVYLLTGATGGPVRGTTNHFWPQKPFSEKLFPSEILKRKVWLSDIGVGAMLAFLFLWISKVGFTPVLALYLGPYFVVNAWLVLYTWLQHTDTDVPHLDKDNWTPVKGSFLTIDRPYGPVLDFLHHRIGSTHVAHHLNHQIPHYHAKEATEAIKKAYPHLYLFDPTPIFPALLRIARHCHSVEPRGKLWVFSTQ